MDDKPSPQNPSRSQLIDIASKYTKIHDAVNVIENFVDTYSDLPSDTFSDIYPSLEKFDEIAGDFEESFPEINLAKYDKKFSDLASSWAVILTGNTLKIAKFLVATAAKKNAILNSIVPYFSLALPDTPKYEQMLHHAQKEHQRLLKSRDESSEASMSVYTQSPAFTMAQSYDELSQALKLWLDTLPHLLSFIDHEEAIGSQAKLLKKLPSAESARGSPRVSLSNTLRRSSTKKKPLG